VNFDYQDPPGNATAEELRAAWLNLRASCFCQAMEGSDVWIWCARTLFDFGQMGLLGLGVPGFEVAVKSNGLTILAYGSIYVIPWMHVTSSSMAGLQAWLAGRQERAIEEATELGDRRYGFDSAATTARRQVDEPPTIH
jgi:hypothetical protein